MKKYLIVVVLIIYSIANAQEDGSGGVFITGGLDWSYDGQYLAVATSQGVYIHRSDDLSVAEIIDKDLSINMVEWSHSDYQFTYDDREGLAVVIYDMETEERHTIELDGLNINNGFWSDGIRWSPNDTLLATSDFIYKDLFIIDVEQAQIIDEIYTEDYTGATVGAGVDWHPDGQYLFADKGDDYALIWDVEERQPAFVWESRSILVSDVRYGSRVSSMRWNNTGTWLAGVGEHVVYVADAETGDIFRTYVNRGVRFYGLSWHPEQDKLASIGQNSLGVSVRDKVVEFVIIWDIVTDEITELPGVVLRDITQSQDLIKWSPDGSRLASVSSDGRVIIWETENYEVIAEYDGYRSLVAQGTE